MTTPNEATRAEEEKEAHAAHAADGLPTGEEERLAPNQASGETAKDYEEMAKLGAEVRGEGELP